MREREREIVSIGHIEMDQDAILVITFSKITHLTGLPTFYKRNGHFQGLRNRAWTEELGCGAGTLSVTPFLAAHWYHFELTYMCFFHSPKLQMSFITYATQGNTVMNLTSNR